MTCQFVSHPNGIILSVVSNCEKSAIHNTLAIPVSRSAEARLSFLALSLNPPFHTHALARKRGLPSPALDIHCAPHHTRQALANHKAESSLSTPYSPAVSQFVSAFSNSQLGTTSPHSLNLKKTAMRNYPHDRCINMFRSLIKRPWLRVLPWTAQQYR